MENLGRYLVIGGVILILLGGGVYLAGRFGLPLGRLPGDVTVRFGERIVYLPFTSTILVSGLMVLIGKVI